MALKKQNANIMIILEGYSRITIEIKMKKIKMSREKINELIDDIKDVWNKFENDSETDNYEIIKNICKFKNIYFNEERSFISLSKDEEVKYLQWRFHCMAVDCWVLPPHPDYSPLQPVMKGFPVELVDFSKDWVIH